MICYFDTSAVLPLLVEEPGSDVAGRLWDTADHVASSRLVYAEARAALAQAHRTDRIDAGDLRRAVTDLETMMGGLHLVELGPAIVRRAGHLAEVLALRGYDAVHLGSAESLVDPDLVLVAGDRPLLRAAGELRIAVADLNTA
ncbi:MAG TPA: type II toxin-antitoxin system VapC family toxin [Acidimicrobiales bacterium]